MKTEIEQTLKYERSTHYSIGKTKSASLFYIIFLHFELIKDEKFLIENLRIYNVSTATIKIVGMFCDLQNSDK